MTALRVWVLMWSELSCLHFVWKMTCLKVIRLSIYLEYLGCVSIWKHTTLCKPPLSIEVHYGECSHVKCVLNKYWWSLNGQELASNDSWRVGRTYCPVYGQGGWRFPHMLRTVSLSLPLPLGPLGLLCYTFIQYPPLQIFQALLDHLQWEKTQKNVWLALDQSVVSFHRPIWT